MVTFFFMTWAVSLIAFFLNFWPGLKYGWGYAIGMGLGSAAGISLFLGIFGFIGIKILRKYPIQLTPWELIIYIFGSWTAFVTPLFWIVIFIIHTFKWEEKFFGPLFCGRILGWGIFMVILLSLTILRYIL